MTVISQFKKLNQLLKNKNKKLLSNNCLKFCNTLILTKMEESTIHSLSVVAWKIPPFSKNKTSKLLLKFWIKIKMEKLKETN